MVRDFSKFSPGILYHDTTVLADIRNCIFNVDLLVIQELYELLKRSPDSKLHKRFPSLVSYVDGFKGEFGKMGVSIQEKTNDNPLLDFYNWEEMNPDGMDPFTYTSAVYRRLYYQEADVFEIEPVPTLLGNLLSITMRLEPFKKLYLLDESCPESIKTMLGWLYKNSPKVEILEGSLEEALKEIQDINFFILNDVNSVQYLMAPRAIRAEVLIPAFRSNLLNADSLEEEPPVLALPEGMDNYGTEFNLSINSIAIPI